MKNENYQLNFSPTEMGFRKFHPKTIFDISRVIRHNPVKWHLVFTEEIPVCGKKDMTGASSPRVLTVGTDYSRSIRGKARILYLSSSQLSLVNLHKFASLHKQWFHLSGFQLPFVRLHKFVSLQKQWLHVSSFQVFKSAQDFVVSYLVWLFHNFVGNYINQSINQSIN